MVGGDEAALGRQASSFDRQMHHLKQVGRKSLLPQSSPMRSPTIAKLAMVDQPHEDKRRHKMTESKRLPQPFDEGIH